MPRLTLTLSRVAQIRLSNVTRDLEQLGGVIGYQCAKAAGGCSAPNHDNRSVWKCPLGRENDAAQKHAMAVSKG